MLTEPRYCPGCGGRGMKIEMKFVPIDKNRGYWVCSLCGWVIKPIQIGEISEIPYKVKMVG